MIKLELIVEDMCHKCPCFEEEVKTTKFYAIDEIAETDVVVLCKNRNLCKQLKSFLKESEDEKND